MSKIFYDHLVAREEVTAELDKTEISLEERTELVSIIDETLHHHVLNTILAHLPAEKHEEFLKKFHQAPHDEKLLDYLKKEAKLDIEEKIREDTKKVKAELLAEIKRAKYQSALPKTNQKTKTRGGKR